MPGPRCVQVATCFHVNAAMCSQVAMGNDPHTDSDVAVIFEGRLPLSIVSNHSGGGSQCAMMNAALQFPGHVPYSGTSLRAHGAHEVGRVADLTYPRKTDDNVIVRVYVLAATRGPLPC